MSVKHGLLTCYENCTWKQIAVKNVRTSESGNGGYQAYTTCNLN